MDKVQTMKNAKLVAPEIPGYNYGSAEVAKSPITPKELEQLKQSTGFTEDDEQWLRRAGEVLGSQTKAVVEKWRAVISAHPHLAKYSLRPNGQKDAHYSEATGLRFEQWILDTCLRPYDQDWLNYQEEMALRHTSLKKNKTDHVQSAPTIRLRDLVAFTAVINDPNILKPFLSVNGDDAAAVDKMHHAWCKSLLLQIALWTEPYTNTKLAPNEW
jgi:hypothetical protein